MSETISRRRALQSILSEHVIARQYDLVRLLAEMGFSVTQATVSRDLRAMGAVKVRSANGTMRYVRDPGPPGHHPRDALEATLSAYALSVRSSGNLVVIRTPPGAAHVVAAAIDGADLEGVLGTVAGDDTLLIVADEPTGGRAVTEMIERIGAS